MRQIVIIFLILFSFATNAQDKDSFMPAGNKDFAAKNYIEAEANYRISSSKFPKKSIASYNLGNAIYNINQPAEAALAFAKAITNSKSRSEKHNSYHNIGNVCMKLKDYANAVQAYKNALINDPTDEESRYNFALAKKMLKDNPPKKDDKKKDDKKKDDKKKEDKKKEDEKKKEEDKKKEQDKKDGDGKDKKEPKPQGQPKPKEGGISKERLQNLLDAVNNEEKKIQDKVNKKNTKGTPVKTEKDW